MNPGRLPSEILTADDTRIGGNENGEPMGGGCGSVNGGGTMNETFEDISPAETVDLLSGGGETIVGREIPRPVPENDAVGFLKGPEPVG